MKKTIFAFFIILVFALFAGCDAKETNKKEAGGADDKKVLVEEIVADNGYVFKRSDRSIEIKNQEQFDDFLNNKEKVLVIFYATWCRYCQDLDSRMPEILEEKKDLIVLNVDIEKLPKIADQYFAYSTPTVVYLQKGKQPYGFKGALPNEVIFEFLKKAEEGQL